MGAILFSPGTIIRSELLEASPRPGQLAARSSRQQVEASWHLSVGWKHVLCCDVSISVAVAIVIPPG